MRPNLNMVQPVIEEVEAEVDAGDTCELACRVVNPPDLRGLETAVGFGQKMGDTSVSTEASSRSVIKYGRRLALKPRGSAGLAECVTRP